GWGPGGADVPGRAPYLQPGQSGPAGQSGQPAPPGPRPPQPGVPPPHSAPPGSYQTGQFTPPAYSAPPAPAYGASGGHAAAPAGGGRRWLTVPGFVALVLVAALAVVVVFQARQIGRLDSELDRANERLTEAQAGDDGRLDSLESRADQLESQAGKVFNPEAVAAAALPSVFRVSAGDFTGTAFAVGKPAADGGSNLFTNYHVVKQVWDRGDREVSIQRRDQRYNATIVKVDETNDIAQLTTPNKFAGLVTATEPVKSGQQIVVVGAPLGLEDTVTTGVVSAFRKLEDGSGTVIQFSAPINPGNSGGPVINANKQVVGIARAKARDAEGIGLAIPIKTACDLFQIC
ncbi:MAG TPA: trypsin-like peptidase domain-containing protein, partial [Pilimelia sp.]|nr:trypsin-like peptidase domain-containing protein [Pilimelia sp.]